MHGAGILDNASRIICNKSICSLALRFWLKIRLSNVILKPPFAENSSQACSMALSKLPDSILSERSRVTRAAECRQHQALNVLALKLEAWLHYDP